MPEDQPHMVHCGSKRISHIRAPFSPEISPHFDGSEVYDSHNYHTHSATPSPALFPKHQGAEIFPDGYFSYVSCLDKRDHSAPDDCCQSMRSSITEVVEICQRRKPGHRYEICADRSEPGGIEDHEAEYVNNPSPHTIRSHNSGFFPVSKEQDRRDFNIVFQRDKDHPKNASALFANERQSSTYLDTLSSSGADPNPQQHQSVAGMKEAVHDISKIKLFPRRSTYGKIRLARVTKAPGPSRQLTGEGVEYRTAQCADAILDIHLTSENCQAGTGPASSQFKGHAQSHGDLAEEMDQSLLYLEVEQMLDNMSSSLSEVKHGVVNGESNLYRSTIEQNQNIWGQTKNYSLKRVKGSRSRPAIPLDVRQYIRKAICSGVSTSAGFDVDIGASAMVLHVDVNTGLRRKS
jgi:hypothetical protein